MGPVEIRPGFRRPPSFHSFAGAIIAGALVSGLAVACFSLLLQMDGVR